MRRKLIALGLVVLAAFTGTALSFQPQMTHALPDARYVALGDSVAAGAGLLGSTANPPCGRSAEAYPTQVAAAIGMQLEHIACGGAKADEGLYGSQTIGDAQLTPQLDEAFAAGAPDVMSITIGANDARWAQFVRQCYAWKCGKTWDDVRVSAYLLDLRWELYRTMTEIEVRSDYQPPKVVLTGYFDPIQGKTCAALPNMTVDEAAWLSTQVQLLNDVISDTADYFDEFVTYAPVDFAGHSLCDADPWVQSLAGVAPVHPTIAGQQAIASSVIAAME